MSVLIRHAALLTLHRTEGKQLKSSPLSPSHHIMWTPGTRLHFEHGPCVVGCGPVEDYAYFFTALDLVTSMKRISLSS